jgi:hypothetical protein
MMEPQKTSNIVPLRISKGAVLIITDEIAGINNRLEKL